MSTVRILMIQPDETDPPGVLGEWLVEAGAELELWKPARDAPPEGIDGYQAVVCLGGAMSAEDDQRYPWLRAVRRVLSAAASVPLPTLGICLGAQLLTVATGGQVAQGADGPEAGPCLVSKKDPGFADPLFADVPLLPDVFQFHNDVITQPPPGATLLASSPEYQHQAYRLNQCVYGIQFHIETTPDTACQWAESAPQIAQAARDGVFDADVLAAAHADIAEVWRPFAHRFVALAGGELNGGTEPRSPLPLV